MIVRFYLYMLFFITMIVRFIPFFFRSVWDCNIASDFPYQTPQGIISYVSFVSKFG